jgi:uncharacterized Zn-binding protein involved in type VI secretion
MPFAARTGDPTNHPGILTGPGVPNVLIGGMPAGVVGDLHTCAFPPPPPHPPTPMVVGSSSVLISGRPALRVGDMAGCSAQVVMGCLTVEIGG